MAKLDTSYGPFVELMHASKVYEIPRFQRPYSWKAQREVAELWNDIVRLYRRRQLNQVADSHFIGSLVIGSAANKAFGPAEVPVIDGQQRLITLSLILCAIRDTLVVEPKDSAEIDVQYLVHNDPTGNFRSLRVLPGEHDRATFEALVRRTGNPDQSTRVFKAYKYVVDQLKQTDVEDDDESVDDDAVGAQAPEADVESNEVGSTWSWEDLLAVIGSQLDLVAISDVAPENAYGVFASLNSTGTPLAQVDLIRNAIFMRLPKAGLKVHHDLWEPLENEMGVELLQRYLHAWTIRAGHNVPAKDIYRSILRHLDVGGEKGARMTVQQFYDDAWSYLLIVDPASNRRNRFKDEATPTVPAGVVEALQRLADWGTTPMEPTLLFLVNAWRAQDGSCDTSELKHCLADLESFVVRRFIAQVPPNDLRSIFGRITMQLRSRGEDSIHTTLVRELLEEARRWPTDRELKEAMLRAPLYRSPGQQQSFQVLKRIALHMESKEHPDIKFGVGAMDYSIEHVLPQTLSEEWKTDLVAWGDEEPHRVWQELRHTAGNLTLTVYNSVLSNDRFAKKCKAIDEKLKLELSREILNFAPVWNSDSIRARSADMADRAVAIWKRPKS